MLHDKLPKVPGGTIKHKLPKGQGLFFCNNCKGVLKKHVYTHQCIRLPHASCYACFKRRGKCKNCGAYYTSILKIKDNSRFLGDRFSSFSLTASRTFNKPIFFSSSFAD